MTHTHHVRLHQTAPNPQWAQRWNRRKQSWRPACEGGFDASRYEVASIDEALARRFVTRHHYSASWPAARLRYGLYDLHAPHDTDPLVGVCVLGVPMSRGVLTNPFPELVAYQESLELSRLVLLDHIPANAESFFVARAFKQAAHLGVRGVVSFADPVPRTNRITNTVWKPGHLGVVYQALGMRYAGRGTARSLILLPDGTTLTARAAAKVTAGESGHRAVTARLRTLGATGSPDRTDPATWLRQALHDIGATRVRHPGNHRYLARIGPARNRVLITMPELPYPKSLEPLR